MHRNSSTYRIFALTMAALMFCTSISFAVDLHYCKGDLKSFSLIGKAKTCHEMAQAKAHCPHHAKMMQKASKMDEEKGCCENKTLHFQFDQDQQIESIDFAISTPSLQFLVAYVTVFVQKNISIRHTPNFLTYKPPTIERNIPVLFQSFLL